MKAAFLFSGQLRGFEYCIEHNKEFLFSAFDEYDTFFYIPDTDGKKLFDLFTPTSVLVERDQIHKELPEFKNNIGYSLDRMQKNGYECKGRMQHYYLQWYGVKKVFDIFDSYKKLNDIDYDAIFRIRTDIKFYNKFVYEKFDGIQISDKSGHGGIHDRLAYGSYENMKYYCSLYDCVYGGKYNDCLFSGNSESKLLQHLNSGNVALKTQPLGFYQAVDCDGTSYD